MGDNDTAALPPGCRSDQNDATNARWQCPYLNNFGFIFEEVEMSHPSLYTSVVQTHIIYTYNVRLYSGV